MMYKHICSQMNVAVEAMIAGCRRHRRRDHAVTRIHDITSPETTVNPTADNAVALDNATTPGTDTSTLQSPTGACSSLLTLTTTQRIQKRQQKPPECITCSRPSDTSCNSQGSNGPNPRSHSYNTIIRARARGTMQGNQFSSISCSEIQSKWGGIMTKLNGVERQPSIHSHARVHALQTQVAKGR